MKPISELKTLPQKELFETIKAAIESGEIDLFEGLAIAQGCVIGVKP